MPEPMTIYDPDAPAAEAFVMQVDWVQYGLATVGVVLVAVLLHRFLRRRLRASATGLASAAFISAMRLDRASRRGLAVVSKHVDREMPLSSLLLNRSVLVAAAASLTKDNTKRTELADVNRLLDQLNAKPARLRG